MPTANAAAAPKLHSPQRLDLKWSLTLRVVGVALICFLAVAVIGIYGTYRDLRQGNEEVADVVARQLQIQLFRIGTNIDVPSRFPDWDPVVDRVQMPGQCIEYRRPDGGIGRSSCLGHSGSGTGPPAWFSIVGDWVLAKHTDSVRPITYRGRDYGTLVVTTDSTAVRAAVWKEVSRLLWLTALLVGAICLLQFFAIGRALRPTRDILAGLDRLARGDLSCRLPSFRLNELQRISEVFNALAAGLEETTRERSSLAARLVDGQEQERRHLARELHDELAQNLSAISAAAASIKATAQSKCPELVPEATKLSQATIALMRSLRSTLESLRAPEIDDFGLAESLAALARDQERRAGGKLRIKLDVDGDLQGLSATAASHVYRIVQEGLTNIGKHANASHARVALDLAPEAQQPLADERRWLSLTIEDDGCGTAGADAVNGNGLGLIGMRERALALGGQLDVIQLDNGFKLHAVIPFPTQVEARP